MALSAKNPIDPKDIADIHLLKNGKIIILIGHGGEKIVLKTELGATVDQVKSAKAVMKAIDSSVQTKIVTEDEADSIIDFVDAVLDVEKVGESLNGALKNLQREALEGLRQSLILWKQDMVSGQHPLLKLNFVEVRDLDGELTKRLNEVKKDKSGIRAFVAVLNGSDGFEKLGRVIAADLFNDNNDRFAVDGGSSTKIAGKDFKFKALINASNIFLHMTQDGAAVSGLDFIAPTSKSKDINQPLGNDEPVRVLADKSRLKAFAANVIADLELLVSPKRGRFSFNKLDANAAKRLTAGMVEGAQLIAAELERKYKKAGKGDRWTAGVAARHALLSQVK